MIKSYTEQERKVLKTMIKQKIAEDERDHFVGEFEKAADRYGVTSPKALRCVDSIVEAEGFANQAAKRLARQASSPPSVNWH